MNISRGFKLLGLSAFGWLLGAGSPALAVVFDPPSVPLCTGSLGLGVLLSGSNAVELDGTAGVELIIANTETSVNAPGTNPNLSTALRKYIVRVFEDDGTEKWRTVLSMTDEAVWAPSSFGPIPQLAFAELGSNTEPTLTFLASFPSVCENIVVLDHDDVGSAEDKFVVVVIGTSVIQWNGSVGTDLSKVNVFVLNASDGTLRVRHNVRPKPGRFLSATFFGSSFFDYDGDSNDELVLVYVTPRPVINGIKQNVKIAIFTYDLLTKALEDTVVLEQSTTLSDAPVDP